MKNMIKTIILEYILESTRSQELFKSWARKQGGNAMDLMDDFLKYQQRLKKKDIKDYDSVKELKDSIEVAKERDNSKKSDSEVEKIFSNDKLLVVMAKNWETSCRYAAGTKWCTGSKDTSSYWSRHNANGTEFIFINRELKEDNPLYKISYYIEFGGRTDWCDALNKCDKKNPYEFELKNYVELDVVNKIITDCIKINEKRHSQFKIEKAERLKTIMSDFDEFFDSAYDEVVSRVDITYDMHTQDIDDSIVNYLELNFTNLRDFNYSDFDEIMDILNNEYDVSETIYRELSSIDVANIIDKQRVKELIENAITTYEMSEGEIVRELEEIILEEINNEVFDILDEIISDTFSMIPIADIIDEYYKNNDE